MRVEFPYLNSGCSAIATAVLVETGHKISDVVNPDLNKLDLNPAVMMMMFSLPPCGLDVCSCDRSAAICLVVSLVASIFMSDQTLGSNQTSAINSPTLKKTPISSMQPIAAAALQRFPNYKTRTCWKILSYRFKLCTRTNRVPSKVYWFSLSLGRSTDHPHTSTLGT